MQMIHRNDPALKWSPTRLALLSSVSRLEGPPPQPDYGDVRFEISRRLLGRPPVVVRHPWDRLTVIFVEAEPDNWREFIEGAIAAGTLPQVMKAAAIEGRAN